MSQLTPLIAGNWKLNGTKSLLSEFAHVFNSINISNVDVLICPPSVYIDTLVQLNENTDSILKVGAQTVSEQISGAFTGEISVSMLKELQTEFVIVGHSERRAIFGETPELVAKKYQTTLMNQLTPILCTGETENDRNNNLTFDIVSRDIDAVINLTGIESFKDGIIAYEPVWAIGTGKSATPQQAQEVHHFIRNHLAKHNDEIAQGVRILYGGSVNEKNAAELFKQDDINGALVGGASLVSDKFMSICQHAQSSL